MRRGGWRTRCGSAMSWERSSRCTGRARWATIRAGRHRRDANLRWYAEGLNAACEADIELAKKHNRPTLKHCLEAKPFEPQAEILLPTSDAMLAFIGSGLLKHPEMVGLNPEYLHELMWGGAPRAALARALLAGKLWHFDINDGYRLKHDVDIAVALVNPLDWLNVLVLLRSHNYNGPFNLDYKPPRTTSNHGVFAVSFPTAVDRFITLWEMAGEVIADPIINEATEALKAGGGPADPLRCRGDHRGQS
jgi:xylose isomerase